MITVGIDEVGRGCWAGPLVAGAVLLKKQISDLDDSKKLSKKQREKLSSEIVLASEYGLGWVTPKEIDDHGLTWAVATAMQRALDQITAKYDAVIIDGNINYLKDNPLSSCLIKADALVPAASAASIIAKVARDNYMVEIADKYPGYGFEAHVGYGTAAHNDALRRNGVTDLHRRSYKPIAQLL